jgi:hypothetical protein
VAADTGEHRDALSKLDKLSRKQHIGTRTRALEHGVAAARWTVAHRTLAVTAGILAAVAGGTLLASVQTVAPAVAAVLALLAAIVSALDASLGASTNVVNHKEAADRFTRVASGFVLLHEVQLLDGAGYAEQIARYEAAMRTRDEAVATSPQPPAWAQRAVRRRRQRAEQSRAHEN